MPKVTTRQQRMAERSYDRVSARKENNANEFREYASFAKSFPALLHTAGLCQAVAFALAKSGMPQRVLEDIVATAGLPDIERPEDLRQRSHVAGVLEYLSLSRAVLQAATWVKRYAEAIEKSESWPASENQV